MNLKTLISEESLQKRIKELGNQITEEYKNKELIIICILTGAVYFATELTKYIDNTNLKIEFMKVSSYGNSTESTGEVKIKKDLDSSIAGKNVIIVEDIIDTGLTMHTLKRILLDRKPESLKICTMLDKKERRKVEINADYVGFDIPNKFVLGYGLDYEEYYRNLPYIAYCED
ncbi:MAG: hypoxanthine phosphoribosyltransferase [Clostridia bacterium]|nr:hypoxanthine phosphoribosyltransferase [Clostridia bacterium]